MAVRFFIRRGAVKQTVNLSCRVYYREQGKTAVNLTVATKLPVNRETWEKGHDGSVVHYEAWSRTDNGKTVTDIEEQLRKSVDAYVIARKGRDVERIKKIVADVITPPQEEETPDTFVAFCDKYVKDCEEGKRRAEKGLNRGGLKSASTVHLYRNVVETLKRYEEDNNIILDYGDMTSRRIEDYRLWMTREGMKTNTVISYSSILMVFLRAADKKKLLDVRRIELQPMKKVQPDTVYLTQEQLDTLWRIELPKSLDEVRDVFLMGCETGQRFSDYHRISVKDIETLPDGSKAFRVKQQKTGATVYPPVTSRALEILKKRGGRLPNVCIARLNRSIKDVCRLAGFIEMREVKSCIGLKEKKIKLPFCELVSTHTARRTAATNMYKQGCPLSLIQALTGHRSEAMLIKYLRLTNKEKGMLLNSSEYFKERRMTK